MRILYLSCHSVLEYDEVKLLRELGHYVFSPNAYLEPDHPGDGSVRPPLKLDYDPEDVALWKQIPGSEKQGRHLPVPASFVARFDAVIVMDSATWLRQQWESLSCKPVVWRTIGQSIARVENELVEPRRKGLKILRYSPREQTIPGYLGADAVIRFYKDPREFGGWNGNIIQVLTVNQATKERAAGSNYTMWELVTQPFPRRLIGPKNEGIAGATGKATYDEMKAAMRDYRAYFYVGSHPASYTLNFMEAWMTGIPIVAIGPVYGNAFYFPGHQLYEIPYLIKNGETGLVSDHFDELRGFVQYLLNNPAVGKTMGDRGRTAAIAHFGYETIRGQWKTFIDSL